MTVQSGFSIRSGGDAHPSVILVPGKRYGMTRPLFAALADGLDASELGWVAIDWTGDVDSYDIAAWRAVVDSSVGAAAAIAAPGAVIVAKSVGTLAVDSEHAVGRPAVWWTPTIGSAADESGFGPVVRAALAARTSADLLIGGTADSLWDREAIPSQHQTLEIPLANHSLEVPGDETASSAIRATVIDATLAYLQSALRLQR